MVRIWVSIQRKSSFFEIMWYSFKMTKLLGCSQGLSRHFRSRHRETLNIVWNPFFPYLFRLCHRFSICSYIFLIFAYVLNIFHIIYASLAIEGPEFSVATLSDQAPIKALVLKPSLQGAEGGPEFGWWIWMLQLWSFISYNWL